MLKRRAPPSARRDRGRRRPLAIRSLIRSGSYSGWPRAYDRMIIITEGRSVPEIETDYLVVGAGASGMAFTDALIGSSEAEVVVVDRRDRPGGHWNDDYSFVRLHQPSAFYGVA